MSKLEKRALTPKLRFKDDKGKEYPGWEKRKLGNVGKIIGGGTPDTNQKSFWDGGINWFTPTEIKSKYSETSVRKISEEGLSQSSATLLPAGTILFTSRATIGRVSVAKERCSTNQGFQSIKVNNSFSNEYIYYWILQNKNQFLRRANGSTFLEIGRNEIKKIPLYIPIKKEQQKIADCLTSIDDLITAQTQKIDTLKAHKKGLMQQLFPAEGETTPKLRFTDDKGKEYPGWEKKRLGEIGKTFNGLTGKNSSHFGKGKHFIQYLQVFESSKINIDNFGLVKIEENESQNTVCYGDVFFTTSSETPNEVGTASVLMEEVNDTYLNSFCFGYRINRDAQLLPQFVQFAFREYGFREKVVRLAQGSTRYNLSKISLMKVKHYFPIKEEQQKIADCLTSIDDLITAQTQKVDTLKAHKKGLMQQLFPNTDKEQTKEPAT